MSNSNFDLTELANNSNLRVSTTSNSAEQPADAIIRQGKDIVMFVIAILLVLVFFAYCCYILLSKISSADDKKWAMAIASAIISAFLGYLTGKIAIKLSLQSLIKLLGYANTLAQPTFLFFSTYYLQKVLKSPPQPSELTTDFGKNIN